MAAGALLLTFVLVCRKTNKERWFILFSDLLVYAAFDPVKLGHKHVVLRLDRTAIGDVNATSFQLCSEQKVRNTSWRVLLLLTR